MIDKQRDRLDAKHPVQRLVNCPFCGSEEVKDMPFFDSWGQEVGSHIKCHGCKMQTADYPFGGAKKLWNNRAI